MRNSLADVECRFSGDTNKGDDAQLCSDFFTEATIALFGGDSGASCIWETNALLVVRTAGGSARAVPGSPITLRGGRIRRSTIGCEEALPETETPLKAPDQPPLVVATITGLDRVQACAPIELDASSSIGGGGRPMEFAWNLLALEGAAATPQEAVDALNATVRSQGPVLSVDTASIRGNPVSFTFGLVARNFLGNASALSNRTVMREDAPVPPLALADAVSEAEATGTGRRRLRVLRTDSLTIGTSIQPLPSQCPTPAPTKVVYTWTASDPSVIRGGGSGFGFVFIPPRVLRPGGVYDFRVSGRYEREAASVSLNVTVEVDPDPPVPVIRKCNRAVEFGGSLRYEVDASASYSPDAVNGTQKPLVFQWACQRSLPDKFGDLGCNFPSSLLTNQSVLELSSSFMAATSDLTAIAGHNYYVLTLTVTDVEFNIASQRSCRIWTQTVGTPEASVEQWIEFTQISPAASTITLVSNSTLNSTEVTASTYEWICQYRDGTQCSLDLASSQVVLTAPNNPTLVLSGSAIPPSLSHTFTLTVRTPGGATGIASTDIILFPGPSPGECAASPPSGLAYNTSFTFRCRSWTGGTGLRYAFLDDGLGILRAASSTSTFATTLPGGAGPGPRTVVLTARVSNAEGGSTLFPISVEVVTPELSAEAATNLADSQADSAIQAAESGDITAASSAVENTKALLDGSTAERQREIESKMLQAVETIVNTVPQTTESVVQKARVFSVITEPTASRPEASVAVANTTVRLLGELIDALSDSPDIDYTEEFGNQTVRAIANVVNTSASSGVGLSEGVDSSLSSLGNAIGSFVSPGQQPLTISQPGLDLSVQKYDLVNTFLNVGGSGGGGGGGGELPAPKVPSLRLGHNAANTDTVDQAQVPISALLNATDSRSPLAIFSSSRSYWPPRDTNTPQTDLVNVAFYDEAAEEIKVSGVEDNGVQILITGAREAEVAALNLSRLNVSDDQFVTTEIVDVCQFWNATTREWSSDGCTGTLDRASNSFLCQCSHLTSFQGAQEAQPKFNSISIQDIQNLTLDNLLANFVTLAALILVFVIYIAVSIAARYAKKQTGLRVCCHGAGACVCLRCCQKDRLGEVEEKARKAIVREYRKNQEIDFLFQWYFQLCFDPPRFEDEDEAEEAAAAKRRKMMLKSRKARLRRLSMKGSRKGVNNAVVPASADGMGSVRSVPGAARSWHAARRRRNTVRDRNNTAVADLTEMAVMPAPDEDRDEEGNGDRDSIGAPHPNRHPHERRRSEASIGARTSQQPISTDENKGKGGGGCAAWCRTRVCCWCCPMPEDPDRVKTPAELQEEKKQRLLRVLKQALLGGGERETLIRNLRALGGKKLKKTDLEEPTFQRVRRLWWHMTKMQHVWLSVFFYHRSKPLGAQWRANVLLQTLLLVMLASGFFYGQNQSSSGEIVVGIISALIVSVLTLILVILAKKIGVAEWELSACEVRDRLCESMGTTTTKTTGSEDDTKYPPEKSEQGKSKMESKKGDTRTRGGSSLVRSIFSVFSRHRENTNKEREANDDEDDVKAMGIAGVGSRTQDVANRVLLYQIIAWAFFAIIVSGSAFTILVLGVKFDLDDKNDGGSDFWNTRSFKWLTSVIIAQGFGSIVMDPLTTLVKAMLLALCVSSALSPLLLSWLIDDDDLTVVNAYDVYLRVVTGYKLTDASTEKLRDLLRRTKQKRRLDGSEWTDIEEDGPGVRDEFADLNLSIAAPAMTYLPSKPEQKSGPGGTTGTGGNDNAIYIPKLEIESGTGVNQDGDERRMNTRRKTLYEAGDEEFNVVGAPEGLVTPPAERADEEAGDDMKVYPQLPPIGHAQEAILYPQVVDKAEGLNFFDNSLIERKEAANGAVEMTIFDTKKNANAGFDDLPVLHGKAHIRHIGSKALIRRPIKCYAAVVRIRFPDARALLVIAKNRHLLEKAIMDNAFADNDNLFVLYNISGVAESSSNLRGVKFSATDGSYKGGFELEVEDGRKIIITDHGKKSVRVRDWWVQVLAAYRARAIAINQQF